MSKLTTEDREEIPKVSTPCRRRRSTLSRTRPTPETPRPRGAQQEKAGNLSAADRKRVDAKANEFLGKDSSPAGARFAAPPCRA